MNGTKIHNYRHDNEYLMNFLHSITWTNTFMNLLVQYPRDQRQKTKTIQIITKISITFR